MALLLDNEMVVRACTLDEAINVVRAAYLAAARHHVITTSIELLRSRSGWIRILPAILEETGYAGFKAGVKVDGVGVRDVILLYSIASGALVSIMDAQSITTLRTAATVGVATAWLARLDSSIAGCIGSGREARAQLEAICHVRPVRSALVYSPSKANREDFAATMSHQLGIKVVAVDTPRDAVEGVDVACSATSSSVAFIAGSWFHPGLHFNAVGATRPEQSELLPDAFVRSDLIVADSRGNVLAQAGDVSQALAAGAIQRSEVEDLAECLGSGRGRSDPSQVTLFKSVGAAIQDIAVAVSVYETAQATGSGLEIGDFPQLRPRRV